MTSPVPARNEPLRQALQSMQEADGRPRFLLAVDGAVRFGVGIHRRIEHEGQDRLRQASHASRQLPRDAMVVGGFAFEPGHEARGEWRAFPSSLFVVPALEWEWAGGEWHERRNGPAAPLEHAPPPASTPAGRSAPWGQQVASALDAIREGHIAKVVLARCERRPPLSDPLQAFARLAEAEPLAHAFYLEPVPGHAFFGATPERLVRLMHGRLETHAVAGTAPRGTKATDAALGGSLLLSEKDTREHRLVVDHIVRRLEGLGLSPEQGMRRLRRMANVQHLETQVTAAASAGLHVLDVAHALHPTPAVCGTPLAEARALIAALEPEPRGWYSGGVGWFNHRGDGEILVALRSALATPEGTWLHAGAGIVEGSEAQAEFEETQAKLQSLLAAVGG